MNWLDAIVEMKKDNSKVFEFRGEYRAKIVNGELVQLDFKVPGSVWRVNQLSTVDQQADWVEVKQFKQFKEVDYAEFMEWYCNPNNKGRFYQFLNQYLDWETTKNMFDLPPDILSNYKSFQIPND